ncbi:MAG: hypothetical protein GF418_01100 [Chitinivibrionales bacterium]|nr:hypothetical protein [Chitinivibrionales bacterium]MBD3394199.1 hypothetical protein [Chitinivibrionales bacterium]
MKNENRRKNLYALVFGCACALTLLLAAEGMVRALVPRITAQGLDQDLFCDSLFAASPGWCPGSAGVCFGKTVRIDQNGYRAIAAPDNTSVSWLLLGDSVTFGIAVETDGTFAGMLQRAHPDAAIRNSAVVAYKTVDYHAILPRLLSRHGDAARVILFYTLNDIYNRDQSQVKTEIKNPIMSLLRKHSRLYVFLKSAISDRSKAYFTNDYRRYDDGHLDDIDTTAAMISSMNARLDSAGIDFLVVLLPYEYQIRKADRPALRRPQRLMHSRLTGLGVPCIDLFDDLRNACPRSKDCYLYGDGIHFSAKGHRAVFEAVEKQLALP